MLHLHIHLHLCKFGEIFCCFGSREVLPAKLPGPESSSNGSNTPIRTQPQRQGGMELPNIIQAGTTAESTASAVAATA
ncbi:uncharacterized protein H6S33_001350 [Morchella sextelata]|uniref:uncharacterized protein n=1 Tax=Morchella sextelata TaxID=1174677 RepID=UPI001D059046|nr:uncharacterized protein H6S33_001350 [Morchella sextelata]KAH0609122.1 hypothetical protein H6S33_001350 [Morchella sextelata]